MKRRRSCPKAERELLAFLDLHPGSHNLEELESTVKNASQAARSLGRKSLLSITREPLTVMGIVERPPHLLNAAQQTAVDAIREAVQAHAFRTFLIHGVTGSGKTEVYLTAIDAALAAGTERAAAGAGNRADARGGGAIFQSFRAARGDSA